MLLLDKRYDALDDSRFGFIGLLIILLALKAVGWKNIFC